MESLIKMDDLEVPQFLENTHIPPWEVRKIIFKNGLFGGYVFSFKEGICRFQGHMINLHYTYLHLVDFNGKYPAHKRGQQKETTKTYKNQDVLIKT